jgi:hypothetical protein
MTGMKNIGGRAVRRSVSLIAALALASAAYALDPVASVREVTGKVETMAPGAKWAAAKAGQLLSKGAQVATGFRSSATLQLGDSLLTVKPLTQMTVEKLIQTGNLVKTELYLRVGKVKADVVTPQGLKNDFKLKSPTATASVRGTAFEFDGDTLFVERGTVVMIASGGSARPVTKGETSGVERSGGVSAPRDEAADAAAMPSLREAIEERGQGDPPARIDVPVGAEAAVAASAAVSEEPVPIAVIEADGTVTILRPGQPFPAGLGGALLVVTAGPPVLIYPSGIGMIALTIGASTGVPAFPSGIALVLPTVSATRPAGAFPSAPAAATPTLTATRPAAGFPSAPTRIQPTISAPANPFPSTYPVAPLRGDIGLSVE